MCSVCCSLVINLQSFPHRKWRRSLQFVKSNGFQRFPQKIDYHQTHTIFPFHQSNILRNFKNKGKSSKWLFYFNYNLTYPHVYEEGGKEAGGKFLSNN